MPLRNDRWSDSGLFLLVALAWGFNYLVVRIGLESTPPLWLAALRAGVGALGVLAYLATTGSWAPMTRREIRDGLLIGVPNTALFFGLWFVAAGSVPPGEAAVLIYTFPLWVTVLSAAASRTAPTAVQALAVLGGFAGVVLVAEPWLGSGSGLPPVAVVELLAGALAWGLGTLAFKWRFPGPRVDSANALQLAGGAATLAMVATLVETPSAPGPTWSQVAIVLWLGLVGTALAYSIWFRLLSRRPASTLSGYTFAVPVVALGASVALLGERVDLLQLLGVVLVVASLYANSRGARDPPAVPSG